MRKSILPSDHRTRDALTVSLQALRPRLEGDGVRHLALFDSVARGDDVAESDVDIAIGFDPDRKTGLFQVAAVAEFLEEALGRPVDIAVRRALQVGRHDEIVADLNEVFLAISDVDEAGRLSEHRLRKLDRGRRDVIAYGKSIVHRLQNE